MNKPNFILKYRGQGHMFQGSQVMGIVNVTPDSFWEGSRMQRDADLIRARAVQILSEGGSMIDVGAYSTRPGAPDVSAVEELDRLAFGLQLIRQEVGQDVPISVDTFRAGVAETCIRELGADIINDISGGMLDAEMFDVVARTRAPYILMHMRGTPQSMQACTDYPEGVTSSVASFFIRQLAALDAAFAQAYSANESCACAEVECTAPQVILDPGYGFAKTLEQNYQLLRELPELMSAFAHYPMLVGISRKSMIYRLLGSDPAHALNGTTVLNTFATQCGAHILRVHDVREAVEVVRIMQQLNS